MGRFSFHAPAHTHLTRIPRLSADSRQRLNVASACARRSRTNLTDCFEAVILTGETFMSRPPSCKVLLVYPRFAPNSFWNYQATCDLAGARYPTTPLGLITVAALLPRN